MNITHTIRSFTSERMAANGTLTLLSLVVVFHLLVLTGLIPYTIVWGGKLQDSTQMLVFEAISITVNLLMLTIVGMRAGYIKSFIHPRIIRGVLWAMFVLFLLNTLGNLFSENDLERIIFTPLTILLSFFSLRLAIQK